MIEQTFMTRSSQSPEMRGNPAQDCFWDIQAELPHRFAAPRRDIQGSQIILPLRQLSCRNISKRTLGSGSLPIRL
jgi:hypothetical protein